MDEPQFYLPNNAVLVVAPMDAQDSSLVVDNIRNMRGAWRAARQPVLDHATHRPFGETAVKSRLRREGLNCLVLVGGFTENSLKGTLANLGDSRFETYVVTDAIIETDFNAEYFAGVLTTREVLCALAPEHEPSRAACAY
jgi:nicotinamidase-related amidase